jgi:hypothetical protein
MCEVSLILLESGEQPIHDSAYTFVEANAIQLRLRKVCAPRVVRRDEPSDDLVENSI